MTINIPDGFRADQTGIYFINNSNELCYISSYFEITKKYEDVDTKEVSYEISHSGGTIILTGAELSCSEGIKKLASFGVNTSNATSKELQKYMVAYRTANVLLPVKIYSKCGWKNGFDSFVIGCKEYSLSGERDVEMHSVDMKYINALQPKGTLAGWIENTKPLLNDNKARFTVYGSCAAPILFMIDGDSRILDSFGTTSIGKSLKNRLAMSVWGHPIDLELSAKNTKTFLEITLAAFNNIPINIDETQLVDDKELIGMIYMIGNETGKGRGNKDLSTRKTSTWKTIALASGEKPLTGENSLGGASVRGISIHGGLEPNETGVKQYEEHEKDNYGLIAPLLIDKLLNMGRYEVKNRYNKCKKAISDAHGLINNNVASRMTDTFAVILLAGELFEEIMKENNGEDKSPLLVVTDVATTIIKETASKPYWLRSLEYVYGWIGINEKKFIWQGVWSQTGSHTTNELYGKQQGAEHLFIYIPALKEAFKNSSFDYDSVKNDWIDNKIIHGAGEAKTIGLFKGRAIAFNPKLIQDKFGLALPTINPNPYLHQQTSQTQTSPPVNYLSL